MNDEKNLTTAGHRTKAHNQGSGATLPPATPARVHVVGRQSNHGSWTLPAGLADLASESLWLAVAIWSHRQARPVTRADIANAFRISLRRAADVISYLLHERAEVVRIERAVVRVDSGHRVGTILVTEIIRDAPPPPRQPCGRKRIDHEAQAQATHDLASAKNLFLRRRPGPVAG